ncbi:aminotransferase class I/II-fold pyridoxal phosphate-dependent enzyme [Euzebya sp.]|uniref:aminotransferase class I/II-fold pyridoxal phosphate-dependent enzyme n=1 Tax=Euzebya sp. TaxID=1971409 RepID=UPI003518D4DD
MDTGRTPHLTARLQGIGTTIFTEVSALALRSGAVNLGQGFPDFDPPADLADAARRAIADGHNQYAPGPGIPTLRAAVAGHATRHFGLSYDPDHEVTVTTGATEAMFATIQALVDVGDEVVLFEPAYDVYPAAVAMAGGRARGVPLGPDADGVWRFDPEALRRAVGPRTRAIVLNSPHNPCGKVYDRDELEVIADVATAADVVVITDEVYEHLVYGDAVHVPIASLPGMHQRTVRISSAGKTFSVTGWKVGWVCAPAPLTQAIRAAKQWVTFTSGTPFQHAVADALTWGETYTAPLATSFAARAARLSGALADLGFAVHRTDGTYFVTVDVRPLGFADDVDFCARLPLEVGVAAIPVSVFFDDPADGRGYVRFAFCKTDELLDVGIARLQDRLHGMSRSLPPGRT